MLAAQYEHCALECLALAVHKTEPEQRVVLLEMAQMWMRLSQEIASIRNRYYARHPSLVSENENQGQCAAPSAWRLGPEKPTGTCTKTRLGD
jgi:hypothetical protein